MQQLLLLQTELLLKYRQIRTMKRLQLQLSQEANIRITNSKFWINKRNLFFLTNAKTFVLISLTINIRDNHQHTFSK